MKKIIMATNNKNKVNELRRILCGYDIISQKEAGYNIEIEETGSTFEENALIKARAVFELSGECVIADDSGLEVFCLDGRPGIYSARYGGENASDEEKMRLLLNEIKATGSTDKRARFVSVIALVTPEGKEKIFRGEVYGLIANEPSGTNGFGYDPVFYIEEYKKTFGELSADIKNKISHRAKSTEKLKEFLLK